MKKIKVKASICFKGKVYIPGEIIPCEDQEWIEAWERAGSVEIEDETVEQQEESDMEQSEREEDLPQKEVRAKSVSAESGIPVEGKEDDLVGKVPKTEARKKK